jgi:hypothetical protein
MFVSCFYFFYSYFVYLHFFLFLCIYLFSIFFFKKILVFFNMFYNENNFLKKLYFCLIRCKFPWFFPRISLIEMALHAAPRSNCPGRPAPTQTVVAGRRQVQWGGCLLWTSCPCPTLFVTTDRQTPLLLLYIKYGPI